MPTLARLLFSLAVLLPSALLAETTQQEIESRVLHKPLYLRGRWRSDKLHFDATGRNLGDQGRLPFTLCGIEVEKVKLKSGKLNLEGKRIGVEFRDDKAERVALKRDPTASTENIRIEIDSTPDFTPALTAIFAESLADLAPTLPPYWQTYARLHLLPQPKTDPPRTSAPAKSEPNVGGAITPPKVLQGAEPVFSEAARALKYGGSNLIAVTLNEQGQVVTLEVDQAIGLGLDEQAMAAVLKYKFEPAKRNGQPIATQIKMEVKFEIY